MKKRILLPILLLASTALVACGQTEPPVNYTWSIANKEALTAEWHVKEANREVVIACEPAINVAEHLDVDLFITSSNTSVIGVSGKYLQPLGEGTATITVDFAGTTDTVEITVLEEAGEPEVVTGLTLAQIFADGKEDRAVLYEVEGLKITSWQSGKTDSTKYGNFMVSDDNGTTEVLVYGATAQETAFAWTGTAYKFTNPQDFQTNDATSSIGLGYTLKMRVARFYYNGTTPELEGVVLTSEAPAAVPAESVTLNYETAYARVGGSFDIKATLAPAGANDTITWTTSDAAVATVNNGKVTGISAGTATITAKVSETISATCNVTVEERETEPTVVTAPVTGTAYKFGIKHTGLYTKTGNDWYYVTGAMDGYYLGTTPTVAESADVYVEETTGGVYLTTTVDSAKKYIDVYVNGTYTNVAYVDEPTAVYTVTEAGHFVTTLGEDEYTIGTSGTSTYNTLSPRKTSATNYVATLLDVSSLGAGEGGSEDEGEKTIVLTVDTLGLGSSTYTNGSKVVNGYTINWIELGNYGNGVQWRSKNKTADTRSQLWFEENAFPTGIKSIEFTYNSAKTVYNNSNVMEFSYDGGATVAEYLSLTANTYTYTFVPSQNATTIKMAHNLAHTYGMFFDSIVITLN